MTSKHLVIFAVLLIHVSLLSYAAPNLFCSRPETDTNRLVQLVVVTRNGMRTPLRTFPTDRYQESDWTNMGGFGQLTNQGIEDQYFLGQFFQKCYPPLSSKPGVSAFSTPQDTALMSANSFLAGLLMDFNLKEVSVTTALQQVIKPVHSLPQSALPATCRSPPWCGDEASVIVKVGGEDRKYRQLLEFIAQNAGLNSSAYEHVSQAMSDAVSIEKLAGLPLVDWIQDNSTIQKLLLDMVDLNCQLMQQNSLPERTLMFTSPLLNFIAPYMNNASVAAQSGKNQTLHLPPKLLLISAHDSHLAALLAAFGDFNGRVPPFSSAVIIELSKGFDASSPVQVSVFYRNDSTVDPFPVSVRNGCGKACPLDKFMDSLKDAMKTVTPPSAFTLENTVAMLQSVVPVDVKVGLFIFGGFCFITLVTVVAALFSCTKRRRKILYRLNEGSPNRANFRNRSPVAASGHRDITSRHDAFFNDEDEEEVGDENTLLMTQVPSGSSARQPLLMSSQ